MRPTLPRRPKALLLDDDPAVLRLLGQAISARGLAVRTAADGAAGTALLLDELLDLDVLVVDLDLPGRDACAMLRLIRLAGGEEDLRVVVLADRPGPAVRARLLSLGADAVADRAHGPAEVARLAAAACGSRRRATAPVARSAPRPTPAPRWSPAVFPALPALPSVAPASSSY